MSSMVVSTATSVSISPGSAPAGVACPTSTRRRFGTGSSRVPAPQPIRSSVIAGRRPGVPSVVRIAAPVGVTSSVATPLSYTGNPRKSSPVAGAGTGSRPCAVSTLPPPIGSGDTCTRSTPSAVEPGHRSHHVDEGVELAHLVEVHRLDRHPVHVRLGLGQPAQHGLRRGPSRRPAGSSARSAASISPRSWKRRAGSVRTERCVPWSPPRSTVLASRLHPSTPRRRQGVLERAELAAGVDQGAEDHVPAGARRRSRSTRSSWGGRAGDRAQRSTQ